LALKASELLEQTKLSELCASIARSLSELGMHKSEMTSMEDLVTAPLPVEDALISLFDSSDPTVQQKVIETYISRLYQVVEGPTILSFILAPSTPGFYGPQHFPLKCYTPFRSTKGIILEMRSTSLLDVTA
jgi:hypothetical protein